LRVMVLHLQFRFLFALSFVQMKENKEIKSPIQHFRRERSHKRYCCICEWFYV
jgi:hypothetical protein